MRRWRPHSLGDETYAMPETTSWIVLEGKSARCANRYIDILFFFSFLTYAQGLSVSCAVRCAVPRDDNWREA